MNFEQLRHLLRASAEIVGDDQFIVIGSQSILGKYPNAPDALLWSTECDLIAKNKPKLTDRLNTIGENSKFHDTHGIYADPVAENTAHLAKGWKGRLVNVEAIGADGKKITGLCLDPSDLFVSKVSAGREKDMEFVRTMIEHRMVDRDQVLRLAATVPNPLNDLQRSRRCIARIEGLYAAVPDHQLTHINVANGTYTGNIVGVSDTVVQQLTIGDDEVVFHQANQIDRVPAPGDLCTVQYRGGRAHVHTHKSQQQGVATASGIEAAAPAARAPSAQDIAASRTAAHQYAADHGYVAKDANSRGDHIGRVLQVMAHHVVQHVGRDQVVVHDSARVPPLQVDQSVHLRYHAGAAQRIEKARDTGRQR